MLFIVILVESLASHLGSLNSQKMVCHTVGPHFPKEYRDPGPHFLGSMVTRDPDFVGSPFSHDTGSDFVTPAVLLGNWLFKIMPVSCQRN